MNATAISRIIKRIWALNIIDKAIILNDCPDDPINDISKCPAIMLAVSRMARVIGRIMSLIDSISTIKGIRIRGVPWGVKWEQVSLK